MNRHQPDPDILEEELVDTLDNTDICEDCRTTQLADMEWTVTSYHADRHETHVEFETRCPNCHSPHRRELHTEPDYEKITGKNLR